MGGQHVQACSRQERPIRDEAPYPPRTTMVTVFQELQSDPKKGGNRDLFHPNSPKPNITQVRYSTYCKHICTTGIHERDQPTGMWGRGNPLIRKP